MIALLSLLGLLAGATPEDSGAALLPHDPREIQVDLSLEVAERDSAARRAVDMVQRTGGYFTRWRDDELELRVPRDSLVSLLGRLSGLGRETGRRQSTRDLTHDFLDNLHGLQSRRTLLQQWTQLLDSAEDPAKALDLQREILKLSQVIDLREGQLLNLQQRSQEARITVSWRLFDRTLPAADGRSPFPWIGRLGLPELRRSFR